MNIDQRIQKMLIGAFIAFLLYTGTYLCLTLTGEYKPTAGGIGYAYHTWMPLGFSVQKFPTLFTYAKIPTTLFFPYLWCDVNFWHTGKREHWSPPCPRTGELD